MRHRPNQQLSCKATQPAWDTASAETNLLRELHWSPTALGIVMGAGGAGGILGALVWQPLERRWGPGPVMLGALSLNPLAQIPLVLVGPGLGGQIVIGIGMVIQTGAAVCHGGLQRAVRQELAPDELQGRAQATGAWLAFSLRPFAALAAGGLGTWLGLHLTLMLITAALVIPFLVLWNSPVRGMRTVAPAALTVTEEPANP
jgi:MFS family permease